MNVELITKEDLNQFKVELLNEIGKMLVKSLRVENEQKSWLKGAEVKRILGISTGTLQNLRLNGTLPCSKVGGLLYYKYDDILKLMNNKTYTK